MSKKLLSILTASLIAITSTAAYSVPPQATGQKSQPQAAGQKKPQPNPALKTALDDCKKRVAKDEAGRPNKDDMRLCMEEKGIKPQRPKNLPEGAEWPESQ
jgi:hypothetical protein